MPNTSPFPYDSPVSPDIVDPRTGRKIKSPYFSQEYVDWFIEGQRRVDSSAERLGGTGLLESQGASIAATPVPMPDLTEGRYRISYAARISRAGSVSSSLTVTIGWTRAGLSLSQSGAAMTGNTTTTQQNGTLFVRADANAAITYATTYADGGGATSMQYELDVIVEKVPD